MTNNNNKKQKKQSYHISEIHKQRLVSNIGFHVPLKTWKKNDISNAELLMGQKNNSAPEKLNLLRAPGCLEENYIEIMILIVHVVFYSPEVNGKRFNTKKISNQKRTHKHNSQQKQTCNMRLSSNISHRFFYTGAYGVIPQSGLVYHWLCRSHLTRTFPDLPSSLFKTNFGNVQKRIYFSAVFW